MSEYPKAKYKPGRVVQVASAVEEKALGDGWFDTPDFKNKAVAAPEKPAAPVVPVQLVQQKAPEEKP